MATIFLMDLTVQWKRRTRKPSMDQDIKQDPDPSCLENQENHHKNSETHVKKRGNLDLGLGLQVSTGEGSEANHSLEDGADMTKTVVSKEKKPTTCV